MRLVLPPFRPGDDVRVTTQWLEQNDDMRDVFSNNGERKIGRVYAIYAGELFPVIVVFGSEPDEWGFNSEDLEKVE